jgi:hypothetical protein
MRIKILLVALAVLFVATATGEKPDGVNSTRSDKVSQSEVLSTTSVPQLINYQGYLTDASDDPITSVVQMTFSIWDAASGGNELWDETHASVAVVEGLFDVLLGSVTPIPDPVFAGALRWLQIQVGTEVLQPRKAIVSVAYAYRAATADGGGVMNCEDCDYWFINTFGPDTMIANTTLGVLNVRNINNFGEGINIMESGYGVYIDSVHHDGIKIQYTGDRGVHLYSVDDDGIFVYHAGSPSAQHTSDLKNGFEVAGAEGYGLFIGKTDTGGVQIVSTGGDGFAVSSAGGRGVKIDNAGDDGVQINSAVDDGIFVYHAGSPSEERTSDLKNGFEVAGAEGNGFHVGRAGNCGVQVDRSGSYGVFVYRAGSHGIYVDSADADGVRATGVVHGGHFKALDAEGVAITAVANSGVVFKGYNGNMELLVEIGEGLDYAEAFQTSSDDLLPGTVVAIDPENPGKLMICNKAYDKKVAGIISGANGLSSGVKLGSTGADSEFPVALAGRVYCKVDGRYGAIEPGDLLTTSDTPGHAMIVKDYTRAQGTIIGKAMEALPDGEIGEILVLVTLQ